MRDIRSKQLRGGWRFLAVLSVCIESLGIVACGGDDTTPGPQSTPDSSTEAPDSSTDAGQDATRADASQPVDSSAGDGAPGTDAAADAPPDSTTETPDASTDAGKDATTADSSPADAGGDGSQADAGGGPSDAGGSTCEAYDASGLDAASVAAGFEQVWQVYRCYSCHQSSSQVVDDAGDGIVLSGNNAGLGDSGTIFPPNLTSDPATGLGCWSDSQIANAILNGIDDEGRTLCKPMPKFAQALTNPDGGPKPGYPMDATTAQEIVDYLRSLAVVENQVSQTTCSSPDAGPADAAEQ